MARCRIRGDTTARPADSVASFPNSTFLMPGSSGGIRAGFVRSPRQSLELETGRVAGGIRGLGCGLGGGKIEIGRRHQHEGVAQK